ncbi:hypothetical protein ABZ897_15000 [Nonomuraea sp. NPDC046802]|uniref:hypothetical protein n=1 Tax=Nonomuraea sp. NPDC046802 TaxID=3154919 RepID=UPI0033EDA3AF
MADDKSRSRRRISIDGAGIERRRTAVQTLVDQAPPAADRVAAPSPIFTTGSGGAEPPHPSAIREG